MVIQVEMNDPHKPGRPDEVERVTRANGWVTTERYEEGFMYIMYVM
jgi:hypothetical protein